MNDLIQSGFDYGDLPIEKVLECETAYQMAFTIENQATRMIGEQFAKAKENVKSLRNGNGWREWCDKKLNISHQSAENYINEYKNGGFVKNFDKFGKSARWLLVAPNTPQEVRDQASALAEAGEDVSVKIIKQLKADYEAERQAREQADALWKETVAYHQKLAESTQHELTLETRRNAERAGQVRTPGGRVRALAGDRALATESLNSPIQGGAAECLLAALAALELDSLNARLVNVVHDELVVECEPEQAGAVAAEVERAMVAGFLAIFPGGCTRDLVEAHSGPNWAAAKG